MISFVLVGPPGSGKGTLAQKFVDEHNFLRLSTGDIFRSMVDKKTPLAKKISQLIRSGEYIPDELTNSVVALKIDFCKEQQRSFILDGYPRNLAQAQFLDQNIEIDSVVNLQIDDDQILIDRVVNRWICPTCQRTYNSVLRPPLKDNQCDFDATKLIHRSDDNVEVIKKRIKLYKETVGPVIEYYRQKQRVFDLDARAGIDENYVKLLNRLGMAGSDGNY